MDARTSHWHLRRKNGYFFSSTGHVYLNNWLRPLSIYSGYQAQVCRMGSIFAEFDLDPDLMKMLLMFPSWTNEVVVVVAIKKVVVVAILISNIIRQVSAPSVAGLHLILIQQFSSLAVQEKKALTSRSCLKRWIWHPTTFRLLLPTPFWCLDLFLINIFIIVTSSWFASRASWSSTLTEWKKQAKLKYFF